jgi:lipooligosaccharide transport system permease protein
MTAASAALRRLPGLRIRTSPVRMVERNVLVFRRSWWALPSGMVEPIVYLAGIGFGVGSLVGSVSVGGRSVDYAAFVAPALMATSAMNGAITDSTFNLFFKLHYARLYESILATPLGIADVTLGEVLWALLRGLLYAGTFLVAMVALGLVSSPWGLLTIPGAVLIGLAFAALGCAVATYMRSMQDINLVQIVLLPIFLFSATFFPISIYPRPLRLVAELSPLTRGVDLLRAFTTGEVGPWLAVDVGALLAYGGLGLLITSRRLERMLLK